MKLLKIFAGGLLALTILMIMAGCEDSGGNSWDDHDFGANDKDLYLCFGDSITAASYLAPGESYPDRFSALINKPVVVNAIPGSTTSDGLDRIHGVLDSVRPGFVIILYGVNDVIMGYSDSLIEYNLRNMIQACIDNKSVPVVCTYCTPLYGTHRAFTSGVNRLNELIKAIASDMGATIVYFGEEISWTEELYSMPDGLHPNAYGHQLMAQVLFDTLN